MSLNMFSSVINILKNKLFSSSVWIDRTLRLNKSRTFVSSENTCTAVLNKQNLSERFTDVGQPTAQSHPHLLKPDELVPGFLQNEFFDRREKFVKEILTAKPGWKHMIIIPSAEVSYMTEKIPYFFRQNTDFRYLTGCLEPDSALMIIVDSDSYKSVLFLRENDKRSELWEGPRTGVTKGVMMFGVDEGYPITQLSKVLQSVRKSLGDAILWYDFFNPVHVNIHKSIVSFLTEGGSKKLESPRDLIHRLRVIKSQAEQKLMQKSAVLASKAIEKAMSATEPGVTEHQLFAVVDYHCRMEGAEYLAYPPVVATGNNANIIHYINNTQQIKNGEMVLMDAGCELHGYCSDITRTWPGNGKFSEAQKTLYEIVLSVQLDLINKCSEAQTLDSLFTEMCKLLGKRLGEAHILSKEAMSEKLEKVAFKLCPHHVSHYLGMDVHDTVLIRRNESLKEGMVVTVEPGVYISSSNSLTKPEFRGCGIRIEDDVLITTDGPEVLSTCSKKVNDIEEVMGTVKF